MQPWRVIIADDERMIREWIREAVNWQSLHLEVIAEAEDGEEALELGLKHEVHLFLVDINMPIMNGMTLIKNIREQLPESRIIIISGHDEFSYAQEAIRLNVDDYITKPINQEQLLQVLTSVKRKLESQVQNKTYVEMAAKQIKKNFHLLHESFCNEWMEGMLTEEEVRDQLPFLQLPASCPAMLGVIQCPEMTMNQPIMKEMERQNILFSIENMISEYLNNYEKLICSNQMGEIIVVIWGEVTAEQLAELEKLAKNNVKILVNQTFKKTTGRFIDIPEVYRRCQAEVKEKIKVSHIVRKAEQYIYKHYGERETNLELVAQTLGVSSVYLSRMIKHDLGISFVHLLASVRMKKAIELLNATNLTINEISEQVGYDTQHYFSTAFKKMIGVSPKQYRNGEAFSQK